MQQYNIPQFIDSEDKIVGPLTIRQFSFLAIGVVIGGFLWYFKPNMPVFVISIIPVIMLSVLFAFVKINGQTFTTFLTNVFIYILKPTLFLWSREIDPSQSVIKMVISKKKASFRREDHQYNQSRVEQIAWTLDTYGEKTITQNLETPES